MNGRAWLTLALVLTAPGCALLPQVTAPADDWASFRRTRVSATLDGRLAAAAHYLERYPQGVYAKDVRAYFTAAEPVYFEAKRRTEEGLYTYLATLPRGPHAAEAKDRLRRLSQDAPGEAGFSAAALNTDARIGAAAKAREGARREITGYLAGFLDPEVFNRPLSRAKADLIIQWSLALPKPICRFDDGAAGGGERRCAKILELGYTAATLEAAEERQLTAEITLVQGAGGEPREITIGGPDLFVRLEETATGRAIAPGDTAGRAQGVTGAVALVRSAFVSSISDDPSCKQRPRPPDVLDLRCGGVRVVVRAASEATEDDRIIITPQARMVRKEGGDRP